MPFTEVIALLKAGIGLDVASVGADLIRRAVAERLRANQLEDVPSYVDLLRRSAPEMRNLIEAVVIPETFFFRHPEGINAFQHRVRETLFFASGMIRVLSVPCSTGEEPYSLAISLLELGLTADRFRIDAFDVSERALQVAQAGVFGNHSFRGTDPDVRARFFAETDAGAQLDQRVRACVRFAPGNVVAENFGVFCEPYQFIFCRNLLIYFDEETQGKALDRLEKLLVPDGLLFVGPAEAGLLTNHGFASARLPMAFGFRRREPALWPAPKPIRRKICLTPNAALTGHQPKLPRPSRTATETPAAGAATLPELEQAGRLADQGRLAEAAEACEALLQKAGPSAALFYLFALIRDGEGDRDQADRFYRKALYLEPNHYEAAIHLALLQEHSGNHAAARVLRDRARRVQEGTR
ncbi:MAG TPA: CheR family methyltransferase [Chthoniobacterales bacterium]